MRTHVCGTSTSAGRRSGRDDEDDEDDDDDGIVVAHDLGDVPRSNSGRSTAPESREKGMYVNSSSNNVKLGVRGTLGVRARGYLPSVCASCPGRATTQAVSLWTGNSTTHWPPRHHLHLQLQLQPMPPLGPKVHWQGLTRAWQQVKVLGLQV